MIPFKFLKAANVSVGGQTVEAPGSQNMPGAGYKVPAGGADIPGMSIHCLSCGKKNEKGALQCKYCHNDLSRIAEDPKKTEDAEYPDGGAPGVEAALQDTNHDMAKSSAVATELAKQVMGGASALTASVGAWKIGKGSRQGLKEERKTEAEKLVMEGKLPETELTKYQHLIEKVARSGNPIHNLRAALKKLRNSSGKFRASMVFGPK